MTEQDYSPLPSAMGLEAEDDARDEVRLGARQERAGPRCRAFDDQVLAALMHRFGGDDETAARYWRLSAGYHAIMASSARFDTAQEVLDYFEPFEE
jgi:xanthine/CO dehydrogenase XdhC/CoxF family maturation factor